MVSPTTGKRYTTVRPPAPLRPFVECLWVHSIDGADPREDRRILPDGRMDLVWIPEAGTLVAGPQSRHTSRPVPAPLLAVGARFRPGVAPELLRVPARELVDQHVPLEAVRPGLAALLDERLPEAGDPLAASTSGSATARRRSSASLGSSGRSASSVATVPSSHARRSRRAIPTRRTSRARAVAWPA